MRHRIIISQSDSFINYYRSFIKMNTKYMKSFGTNKSFNNTMDTLLLKRKVPAREVDQLAQKHYKQAMRYVYRKNKQESDIRFRQNEITKLDKQCSFEPQIQSTKYSKTIERFEAHSKSPKHIELAKWGLNHKFLRQQNIMLAQASKLRYSLEKIQQRKQSRQKMERSLSPRDIRTDNNKSKNVKSTLLIPGVNKYYLNQARALAVKNNQVLKYRGNQKNGFTFH